MSSKYRTKLLIVDDLPENLQALTKVIEKDDREIFQATSGEAALSLLLEHEFALAILDVMMPGMNGFELAELMRSTERTSQIPIIFVSAVGKETNFAFRGYESGAVDFLHKPLDIAAVRSKVNVFISLHQQRQEIKRQVYALQEAQHELHVTQLELKRALEMRDEFISMVAHELRTPLNTLHLETQVRQMMLDKDDEQAFTKEKLRAMVARDSRQIKSMTRLITDMTDISRIQSGHLSMRLHDVDLADLVRRILDDLRQQAEAAGCELSLHLEPGLEQLKGQWDAFRLEQIIVNLLTNAFRYGAGKPVAVSLTSNDGEVLLQVQDQGTGLSEEDQAVIFEKFRRVGSRAVREGLGMGLYIARQLAQAQGGSLSVSSKPGKGATFTLTLKPIAMPLNLEERRVAVSGE